MKDKKGFTLIEILVSLAAFSLVMVSMGSAFYKIYNDWLRQRDYNLVLENSRWAMEFMSNEIRSGFGDDTVSDAAESLVPAHKLLKFEVPSSGKIYYWLGASGAGESFVLYRGVGNNFNTANNARRELCRFVESSADIFNVFDAVALGDNCTVSINLTVRPRPEQPESAGNRNFTFRTRVRPRN